MKNNTWEMLAGHYGLNCDDLIYILDRKISFEEVKKICEYWEYCYKEGHLLETLREADKAYRVLIAQSAMLNSNGEEK